MKKLFLILTLIFFGFTFSCTTERRDDQGEYGEEDNELMEEDTVTNEEDNY